MTLMEVLKDMTDLVKSIVRNKMIQNIFDNIKLVRWFKGGDWVKTEKRGWITWYCYEDYLSYDFDPIIIKYEEYKIKQYTDKL